jgi:hypothetical protein
MTKHGKWIATTVAIAGGLAMASSGHAQAVTGDPTLDNFNTRAASFYPSWTGGTVAANGLTISSTGYGSLYYPVPVANQQVVNSADTQVSLTFTISAPTTLTGTESYYVGVPFILDDNDGNTAVVYGGYGSYGLGTWTETVPISSGTPQGAGDGTGASLQASIAGGGDVIGGFNLEFDPAGLGSTTPYTVTFDSLTLSSPVPEPGTLELMGMGAAGLLAFCRRKK